MKFTLRVLVNGQHEYAIQAVPYEATVGFVYRTLELRATCYATLHDVLDFFIQEIVDDVVLRLHGLGTVIIAATLLRDDTVVLEAVYPWNLADVVKHFMVPMWHLRFSI